MKSKIFSMLAAAGLMAASSAMAADAVVKIPADQLAVIKKNGFICHTCHHIEGKLIGPAWMDISKKYKGQKTYAFGGDSYRDAKGKPQPAETLSLVDGLVKKVSLGGHGGGIGDWQSDKEFAKRVPMQANDPNGKKQDAVKELVQYMLDLSK